jgi:hypothetical protein
MVTIVYNHEAVKSMTKEEFLEMHQHLAEHTDLSADYDKIVPPKKEKPSAPAKKPAKGDK